jgi:hypothetical protein
MRSIPVLRVAGGHREVGAAVGRSHEEQLALAAQYRAVTLAATPWLVDEIEGAAEGAAVDPLALFAASIEEIWTVRPSQATAGQAVAGRCSDLVAGPPLTADGHVWVAHNNDLAAASVDEIVAIEWRVPGEPVVFSIGVGPWISVGWNDAGLSLTGNELAPNDERVGVPRLLMVREQLTARSLAEATAMAVRPDRASSYNTVFAHCDGGVVNVEGSATDAELTGLDEGGALAHTNHYVCERMLPFEGDPAYARLSAVRYARARELLADGPIDPARLRAALADHATDPSICRHPGGAVTAADTTVTAFWSIADVTTGEISFGPGNPCQPGEQRHSFWVPNSARTLDA